tara:strand:+ start:319 stop:579 length:261 start_codon:yes stop_codon:yes gene_type:complete
MSAPFKMKGFSGFGNSPMKQDVTKMKDQELVHYHGSLKDGDERNKGAVKEISNRYKTARSGGKKFEGTYTNRYDPKKHKYSWSQPK